MKDLMITVIIVTVLMASFAGCSRLENFSTDSSAATVSSRTNEAPTVVISIDKNTLAAITESTAVISTDTFSQTQPKYFCQLGQTCGDYNENCNNEQANHDKAYYHNNQCLYYDHHKSSLRPVGISV